MHVNRIADYAVCRLSDFRQGVISWFVDIELVRLSLLFELINGCANGFI